MSVLLPFFRFSLARESSFFSHHMGVDYFDYENFMLAILV